MEKIVHEKINPYADGSGIIRDPLLTRINFNPSMDK